MSDENKPGFVEGIMRGLEGKIKEPDSPQVVDVKEFIASKQLTNAERGSLAGWLMGEMFTSAITDAIGDKPPE